MDMDNNKVHDSDLEIESAAASDTEAVTSSALSTLNASSNMITGKLML
jgi:hypothetical protein